MLDDVCYTIGVKRKFFPGFKKFSVVGHRSEPLGEGVRLVLRCGDGSLHIIPDLAKLEYKVYPDYDAAIENQEKLKTSTSEEEAQTDGIPGK